LAEDNAFSHLVVVGASAGSIEALSELVSTLPQDFAAPIVITQHLDPERVSYLEQILSSRSTLPVRTVSDHVPLEAGVIFVVPSSHQVNITDHEIAFQTCQDVTAHREAEEELRESEERLRQALEIETVGVLFFKVDGSITDANEAFLGMSGYSREDLAEGLLRWDDMTPPEWMPHSLKAIEEFRTTGRTTPYEKEYIRKDGSRWWAMFAATRLGEEEGVEFVIDITESKRAEEALRESELRLRTLMSNIPGAVFRSVVREGQPVMQFVSDRIEEITGYPASDFVADRVRWYGSIIHPEDLPKNEATVWRAMERGEPYFLEYRILHADGGVRWVNERGSGVFSAAGKLLWIDGAIFDITEHQKAEEEREQLLARELSARAQAEERRRLSRELHDRVAHDIALVHQSLELHEALKERDPERAKSKFELARKTTKEALESIRNLSIKLRRPEVSRGLEAALSDLLRDVVPPTANFDLSAEGDETLVPSEARAQVFLILREALRNAVAHSGCSRITVRLGILPEEIVGSVEDDGRGFRTRALQPADHNGLKSMQERASLLGGTLDVFSAPGRGTTVKVTIPLEGGARDGR
jgi:PAS domain S-box-containing protein